MINSKIPQGGLWHTKKVFFGVPFKFVINILKLLTYPGTYYEQCFAFKMTKISLGRYLKATATKTSIQKWIRAASNFIALIPSRLIRQMLAIDFSGV